MLFLSLYLSSTEERVNSCVRMSLLTNLSLERSNSHQPAWLASFLPTVNHWKKKWSHFDLKCWVTGRTKIQPGIPSKAACTLSPHDMNRQECRTKRIDSVCGVTWIPLCARDDLWLNGVEGRGKPCRFMSCGLSVRSA